MLRRPRLRPILHSSKWTGLAFILSTSRAWLLAILVSILATLAFLVSDPVAFAVILLVTGLSALALAGRDDDLVSCIRAVESGKDAGRVARRLSQLPLAGRPRLRRDVAVRCLLLSGRLRRLDRRLRREARRWLIEAHKEMKE